MLSRSGSLARCTAFHEPPKAPPTSRPRGTARHSNTSHPSLQHTTPKLAPVMTTSSAPTVPRASSRLLVGLFSHTDRFGTSRAVGPIATPAIKSAVLLKLHAFQNKSPQPLRAVAQRPMESVTLATPSAMSPVELASCVIWTKGLAERPKAYSPVSNSFCRGSRGAP